jgi:hypothetical protein
MSNPFDYKKVRESSIEEKIIQYGELRGWLCMKFVSPGLRGVTDRLFMRTKGGISRIVFAEVKKPGEEPTPQQMKRMDDMRGHGAEVHWWDSLEQARAVLY